MLVKVPKGMIASLALVCSFCILYALMQSNAEYPIGPTCKTEAINKSSNPAVSCKAWIKVAEYVKNCVAKAIKATKPGDLWNKLDSQINGCTPIFRELFGVQFLSNTQENKGFIDYVDNVERTSCVLVTLGVGNDIEAEKKLLNLVPNCRLFGADPILASGQVFNQIGKYFQIAVSGESGNENASVLEDNTYKRMNLTHVGFVHFITKMLNVTIVDHLWLDAEGAEYRILPLLSRGGAADLAGITVCQIPAELHGPVTNYQLNMTEWEQIVTNFLTESDFFPMWSETAYGHYRMYLINYRNPICVRKFFNNWCYH